MFVSSRNSFRQFSLQSFCFFSSVRLFSLIFHVALSFQASFLGMPGGWPIGGVGWGGVGWGWWMGRVGGGGWKSHRDPQEAYYGVLACTYVIVSRPRQIFNLDQSRGAGLDGESKGARLAFHWPCKILGCCVISYNIRFPIVTIAGETILASTVIYSLYMQNCTSVTYSLLSPSLK